MNKIKIKNVTVTGLISPLSFECGNYTNNITILATSDDEYIIDTTTIIGEELLGLLFENVELSGTVRKTSYGMNMINVKNYKVLDNYLAYN